MTHSIILPRALCRPELPALAAAIQHAGSGVALDGQAVERIGQAGLQLLVAACRDADACLVQPSAALRETLELCGLGHLLMGTRP